MIGRMADEQTERDDRDTAEAAVPRQEPMMMPETAEAKFEELRDRAAAIYAETAAQLAELRAAHPEAAAARDAKYGPSMLSEEDSY